MKRTALVLGVLVATSACAKQGGGGGGGAALVPEATAVRLDTLTGTAAGDVSLQDGRRHPFVAPTTPGSRFDLAFDTVPSGRSVTLTITESGRPVSSATVKTPVAHSLVSGAADGVLAVAVHDPEQANLVLTGMSLRRTTPSFSSSSFTVFVHLAGDGPVPASDDATFVGELLTGVNALYAGTGIQIDVATSGFRRLSSAEVAALDPALVLDGRTVLDARDASNPTARAARWGLLGVDESDALHGDALDVFVVDAPLGVDAIGLASTLPLRGQGGVLRGRGLTHAIVLTLADPGGRSRPGSVLRKALAHELGHFLSLAHTTEADLTPDDLGDTPFTTAAGDTDGDGRLEVTDRGGLDAANQLYPFEKGQTDISPAQAGAMRAYLALREH